MFGNTCHHSRRDFVEIICAMGIATHGYAYAYALSQCGTSGCADAHLRQQPANDNAAYAVAVEQFGQTRAGKTVIGQLSDRARLQVIKRIPVGHHPRSVAVNPVTNKIYMVNYGPDSSTCRSSTGRH